MIQLTLDATKREALISKNHFIRLPETGIVIS
jgi:hypothetical protein